MWISKDAVSKFPYLLGGTFIEVPPLRDVMTPPV